MCSVFGPMCSLFGRMCSVWRRMCSVFGRAPWLGNGHERKARFPDRLAQGGPFSKLRAGSSTGSGQALGSAALGVIAGGRKAGVRRDGACVTSAGPMCPVFCLMCPVSGRMCPVWQAMCPVFAEMCPVWEARVPLTVPALRGPQTGPSAGSGRNLRQAQDRFCFSPWRGEERRRLEGTDSAHSSPGLCKGLTGEGARAAKRSRVDGVETDDHQGRWNRVPTRGTPTGERLGQRQGF